MTHDGDSGSGSLRQAIADAAPGALITFDAALSGRTITLTSGQLVIDDSLTISARSLPHGITLDANGSLTQHRVLEIQPGHTVTLSHLTLTGGRATGTSPANRGGGIYNNQSVLNLESCTLAGNSSSAATFAGGGIYNQGGNGGSATLRLDSCTLAGNSATGRGGAIYSDGSFSGNSTVTLTACTVSGNSASQGGGIYSDGAGSGTASLTLGQSIVAANTASVSATGADLFNDSGSVASLGGNLIGNNSTVAATFPTGVLNGTSGSPLAPVLAPLGNYGGRTPTLPPLAGSPAIDSGSAALPATDQRGYPRLAGSAPDIGAVELGPVILVDDAGDSPATPTTLRKAIADATVPASVIRFAPGITTIALAGGQLEIPATADGLFIDASDVDGGVTLDAAGNSRHFSVPAGATVAIHGLAMIDGKAPDGQDHVGPIDGTPGENGGAILSAGVLTLVDCQLADNRSGDGGDGVAIDHGPPILGGSGGNGGAIFDSGRLTLIGCTVSSNETGANGMFSGGISLGGAVYSSGDFTAESSAFPGNQSGGEAGAVHVSGRSTLARCTFTSNLAETAGAISVRVGMLVMTDCVLTGNSSVLNGGAIFNGFSNLTMTRCTFAGNSAGDSGGGLFSNTGGIAPPLTGSTTLRNCTLSGNSARSGGGLYNFAGMTSLAHCTVVNNSATFGSTGGTASRSISPTATVVESSVVTGNSGTDVHFINTSNTFISLGHNLIGTGNATAAFNQTGDVTGVSDALLAPLGDYGGPTPTRIPLYGSPAIDAAAPSLRPGDQRGLPVAGTPDIGAAEFQPGSDLALLWESDFDLDGSPYGVELALGTDPSTPDPAAAANLAFTADLTGNPVIAFGRNPSAPPGTRWVLTRSPDLSPGSFEEIFRFDGSATLPPAEDSNVGFSVTGTSISVTDKMKLPGKAFYRFEAETNP